MEILDVDFPSASVITVLISAGKVRLFVVSFSQTSVQLASSKDKVRLLLSGGSAVLQLKLRRAIKNINITLVLMVKLASRLDYLLLLII